MQPPASVEASLAAAGGGPVEAPWLPDKKLCPASQREPSRTSGGVQGLKPGKNKYA